MRCPKSWMVVLVLLFVMTLSACAQKPATNSKIEPARLEPIAGTDLKRVVLTERAIERLDVQTTPVVEDQVVRKRILAGEVVDSGGTDPNGIWVRVALNEGDRDTVDANHSARVLPLTRDEGSDGWSARPVEPSQRPVETTPTLYYAVDGTDHGLTPGQAVLVELPLAGGGLRKIIPYAAVIYDLHGETWAYTSPAPRTFVRHLILVDYIEGGLVYLLEGPPAGTDVVTVGVAELWGVELGVGK